MSAKNILGLDALLGTDVAAADLAVLWDASAATSVKTLAETLQTALSRVGTGGTLYVRQLGGTPGTDELQISHSGTVGLIDSKDGSLTLKVSGVGDLTLDSGGAGGIIATGSITYKNGLNGWDGKQVGFAYPGDVSNTSGIKSPVAGVLVVTDGSSGTGWLQNSAARARVAADVTNDSDTLAAVTGLSVTLKASRTYSFTARLFVTTGAVNEGVKVALGGTATITDLIADVTITSHAATPVLASGRATAFDAAVGQTVAAAGGATVEVSGTITVDAAGTLTVKAAKNADTGATVTTIERGSWLWVEDMP